MPVADQGINQERYMLIPRTLVFLSRDDKLLLLKGGPQKRLWANLYNGIGGHIEPDEDVTSAAYREIKEETGLIPDDLWLCMTIIIDTGQNPGIVIFVFRGQSIQGEPSTSSEGVLEWVEIDQIRNKPVVEDLLMILDHIMAMRKGDPPLSVHYRYDATGSLISNISRQIKE